MTVIERIQGKQAKINKLEALIGRKRESIAKKTAKLAGLTGYDRRDMEYSIETLTGEIADRERDIRDLRKEIEDLQPLLQKFMDRETELDNLRKVLGVFMDDLESSWNAYDEDMLAKVTPRLKTVRAEEEPKRQSYFDELSSMSREDASKAYEPFVPEYSRWRWNGISKYDWEENRWNKDHICNTYADGKVTAHIRARMVKEFGVGYDKYIIGYGTTAEQMMERFRKDNHHTVEELVLDLQRRIAYKVGEVTDYSHLHVGMKALNGVVTGTLGKCTVESILVGGYNIVRLHVRVLVK